MPSTELLEMREQAAVQFLWDPRWESLLTHCENCLEIRGVIY